MVSAVRTAQHLTTKCGERAVLEIRAVLGMVPPLLADMIRQVVAARAANLGAALHIVAEIDDFTNIGARLDAHRPHLMILGPCATALTPSIRAQIYLRTELRVLTLSSDLAQVLGPNVADCAPLTPDSLAQLVLEISQSI